MQCLNVRPAMAAYRAVFRGLSKGSSIREVNLNRQCSTAARNKADRWQQDLSDVLSEPEVNIYKAAVFHTAVKSLA